MKTKIGICANCNNELYFKKPKIMIYDAETEKSLLFCKNNYKCLKEWIDKNG